jgi:hypothetical protein
MNSVDYLGTIGIISGTKAKDIFFVISYWETINIAM